MSEYMSVKLSDLNPGQMVWIDDCFPCADAGQVKVEKDEHGLFFQCDEGRHHLDIQVNESGTLSGIAINGDPTIKGRDPYYLYEPEEDELVEDDHED